MNTKKISQKLKKITHTLFDELASIESHPLFCEEKDIYTTYEKLQIIRKYKSIHKLLQKLMMYAKYHGSFLFGKNKNHFLITHYCIQTLAIFLQRFSQLKNYFFLQNILHENKKYDFLVFVRFFYEMKTIYFLNYPREFLFQIETDKNLEWMKEKKISKIDFFVGGYKWEHSNFYFFFQKIKSFFLTPIAKWGGNLLSHIKLKQRSSGLISRENIDDILPKMMPGDIIVTRQNFIATNISIPGFWKHMALYKGNGEIIDATGNGVQARSIYELALENDYLGVVRTNFSQKKIQRAIQNTLSHLKSEYDYEFNFLSDKKFICSELITKAYLKEFQTDEGLNIRLRYVSGALTYPPNDLIKKMSCEINHPELTPVCFIDCSEKKQISFESTLENFQSSYKRSRFSFFLD